MFAKPQTNWFKLAQNILYGKETNMKVGDIVNVYDRYRFAIPLRATITGFSGGNDGVSVSLLKSNNPKYQVGSLVWVHKFQLEPIELSAN